MKQLAPIVFLLIIIYSCAKEECRFELFSPEAFAYSLDDSYELNTSCQAKGFSSNNEEGKIRVEISFSIDIKTPSGELKKNIFSDKFNQLLEKDATDLQLNAQIKLDSTYQTGKHSLIINAKDELSGKRASIEKEFEL